MRGENNLWGYLDKTGKFKIEPAFTYAKNFSEGLALVEQDDSYGYINKNGKFILKDDSVLSFLSDFHNNRAWAIANRSGCVFINKRGEIVSKSSCGPDFSDNVAVIRNNLKDDEVINTSGKVLFTAEYRTVIFSFSDGLAKTSYPNSRYGFINTKGKIIIDPKFVWADDFYQGYATVKSSGKYGLINKKGEFVVLPVFKSISPYKEGLAKVRVGDKFGYLKQPE